MQYGVFFCYIPSFLLCCYEHAGECLCGEGVLIFSLMFSLTFCVFLLLCHGFDYSTYLLWALHA